MPSAYILVGPTAAGKTELAHRLAERLNLRILSTDSMLVYRGMDIGTAKPAAEDRERYRYLGLDLVNPDEEFSTGKWIEHARNEIWEEETVIAVGGTGLYVSCLLQGLDVLPKTDPKLRERLEGLYQEFGVGILQERLRNLDPEWYAGFPDLQNHRRLMRAIEILELEGRRPESWGPVSEHLIAGVSVDRETLHRRILSRVESMFELGLLDEVRALLEAYPAWSVTASKAIGYEEARAVLDGRMDPASARTRIATRTRRLAKRQGTWFRHKLQIEWVELAADPDWDQAADAVAETWARTGPVEIRI